MALQASEHFAVPEWWHKAADYWAFCQPRFPEVSAEAFFSRVSQEQFIDLFEQDKFDELTVLFEQAQ